MVAREAVAQVVAADVLGGPRERQADEKVLVVHVEAHRVAQVVLEVAEATAEEEAMAAAEGKRADSQEEAAAWAVREFPVELAGGTVVAEVAQVTVVACSVRVAVRVAPVRLVEAKTAGATAVARRTAAASHSSPASLACPSDGRLGTAQAARWGEQLRARGRVVAAPEVVPAAGLSERELRMAGSREASHSVAARLCHRPEDAHQQPALAASEVAMASCALRVDQLGA